MFLAIIASNSLATMLARKASGRVDGFIDRGTDGRRPQRAAARRAATYNEIGEPIYGERDVVDLAKMAELGLPFWLAGGAGSPEGLRAALARPAPPASRSGRSSRTATSRASRSTYKRSVLEHALTGDVTVYTDPSASPTGYPVQGGGLARERGRPRRGAKRVCDLGYLRVAYKTAEGKVGLSLRRSEPVDQYVKKGGAEPRPTGRRCLCNALMSNIGLAQVREGGIEEPPLLTSGDDLLAIGAFLRGRTHYSAADVLDYLLGTKRPD